ncbi:hypothetical protein F4861DRAFT_495530 [Xylaria intraflava]|nr:hypothetical protein F4861DRAFT_495530 [Xylaria intraflava]
MDNVAWPAWTPDGDDETQQLIPLLRDDSMMNEPVSNENENESEPQGHMDGNDRRTTAGITAGEPPPSTPLSTARPGLSAAELAMERFEAAYIDEYHKADGGIDERPESSSQGASRGPRSDWRPCSVCSETINPMELARAPCSHEYCRGCLGSLFRRAVADESLFPPRCCRQDIPVDVNRSFLDDDLVHRYEEKAVEFSTPNRTYCHRPTCSTFVPPQQIVNGVARCPSCTVATCVACKQAWHHGACPIDRQLLPILQIAGHEGWRRCPNCSAMVELNMGVASTDAGVEPSSAISAARDGRLARAPNGRRPGSTTGPSRFITEMISRPTGGMKLEKSAFVRCWKTCARCAVMSTGGARRGRIDARNAVIPCWTSYTSVADAGSGRVVGVDSIACEVVGCRLRY